MSPDTLRCSVEDRVLTITLRRPESMNALRAAMRDELIAAFDRADADADADTDADEVRAFLGQPAADFPGRTAQDLPGCLLLWRDPGFE